MSENFKIPLEEREKFTQPLGKLISGTRSETIPKIVTIIKQLLNSGFSINIYLVGDIVSHDFIENHFLKKYVRLCVVDEKTQRNQIILKSQKDFEEILEFKNPKGTIRKESFTLFKQILFSKKMTLLKVIEGEEDLLVLPLVSELVPKKNLKNLVFYGQPPITDSKHIIPEGIVMVEVNKRTQKQVKKFLSLMQKD
ncbi:MAG: DUF359 domain-containing protein [Candidatus Hodarchaeota archaeon]